MNPIQKAWLSILRPIVHLVNDKLANRSGLVGRTATFFKFGPREFGYHPLNRLFVAINRRVLMYQAFCMHRYSYVKSLTHNGFHMVRPYKSIAFVGPMGAFMTVGLIVFSGQGGHMQYSPDTLAYVKMRFGVHNGLPLNTMNMKKSAHYIEINKIYQAQMMKLLITKSNKIKRDRGTKSTTEKKTKYADPSYSYVALPSLRPVD